ncbi:MAG: hypothetical protein ND866_27590, partial [Pyrinomonadaceae bacterium]|nr:hypothetical protein [Pyrinomonadaceae bacterium]
MSNFLKNLAKRGAGLPLSAEYSPRPSIGVETRFGSKVRSPEIASEEAPDLRNEAPLAIQAQPMNASSTFSTTRAHHSSGMAATTPSQPSTLEPTTIVQPLSPGPEPFLRPSVAETARVPVSDHTDETSVPRHELREHSAAAVAASIEPAGQSTRVESNPQAITWERRELQGLLRPGVSTEATHEN